MAAMSTPIGESVIADFGNISIQLEINGSTW
jgi:hypothetical protein